MRVLKAHVKGGRLLLDEPTNLPDGSEVSRWRLSTMTNSNSNSTRRSGPGSMPLSSGAWSRHELGG